MAKLSDEELVGALSDPAGGNASASSKYAALADEFMARHGAWLKGRCAQLARHYWRGDSEFADEVFARFSEKLARQRVFAGLREPDKWRAFLAAELDHHAQDLGRFLRAARRDRRAEDGTPREVAFDEGDMELAAPAESTPFELAVARENVAAVQEAVRALAKAAAAGSRANAAREVYNLQMFVRVILQGQSRKDLALDQLSAGAPDAPAMTLDGARKRIERAVIGGVTAIAGALEHDGHRDLAQSFRDYLRQQRETRGRGPRPGVSLAPRPEQP